MEENKLIQDADTADLSERHDVKNFKDEQLEEEEDKPGYPTMDNLLNRLGYTNYHILMIIGCCLFYFSEGAQLYAFNLLIPVFNVLLNLSPTTHIIMNSICYIGYASGSFFVGLSTKYFNRKIPLLTCLAIYSFVSVFIVFYESIIWISICRFIIGFCIGMISSLYLSNMSEYLPVYYRELTIGIVLSNYILGILFYIYSFKLLMPNFDNYERWRIILLVVSIPCIISFIFSIFVIRNSPRLLLNKDNFSEAVVELQMLTHNTGTDLTAHELENLKREVILCKSKNIDFSFSLLFSSKFYFLTTINLLLLLTTSSAYVSNFFSLPLIL